MIASATGSFVARTSQLGKVVLKVLPLATNASGLPFNLLRAQLNAADLHATKPAVRIRSHLLLLTAIVLVPGFLAAAIAVKQVRDSERETTLRGLRETVRATALLVDGEVQRSLGALTALAHSQHLQTGNLEAFYRQAAAGDQRPDVWTLLLDDTGSQRVNTRVPFGPPPPPPTAKDRVATVLATQRPLVSDLFQGPATGTLLTTIYLPAAPSPAGIFVVAQAFSVEHWKKAAMQPEGRADWIVAVIDRTGKFISRSQRTDEYLGRQARPELIAAAAAARDGLIRHSTLEGIDSYDAFTHSALTGWTIAVAAPVATIEASATRAIAWLAAGVAVALGVALVGASLLSRMLLTAIETASAAARTLGKGNPPSPPRTLVHEVNTLNDALSDAADLLAKEKSARELAEAGRQQLLANERAARQLAQRENIAKDAFLAMLGHELRNPLAAIAGASEVLARGGQDAASGRRFIGIIQRQNRHLSHIVNDLLEVSRMLSGKIALDERPLDLGHCVRHCVESLRSTDRAMAYRWQLNTGVAWVQGDAVRLEQIVNNLVVNAMQFSPPGSEIRVSAGVRGNRAVVEVADDGAGIAAELLPRIFEPFVQGPALSGRPSSGLGIGLALARQLVELHGGELAVRSAGPDEGSVFTVTLPLIASPPEGVTTARASPVTPCRVMLVEDNADARESMAESLRLMGYSVVEAADGDEALRAAVALAPDIVVMDLGLPGKSGHQVAAEMRSTPALKHVPLIALSGYGQVRDKQDSVAAGFNQHLVKPVPPDALAQAIDALLAQGRLA